MRVILLIACLVPMFASAEVLDAQDKLLVFTKSNINIEYMTTSEMKETTGSGLSFSGIVSAIQNDPFSAASCANGDLVSCGSLAYGAYGASEQQAALNGAVTAANVAFMELILIQAIAKMQL